MDYSLKSSKYPKPAFLSGNAPNAAAGPMLPPLVPAAAAPPAEPPLPADESALARINELGIDGVRECVRVLGASPVELDRAAALKALAANRRWADYRPVYAALRKVALTEYRVEMRKQAVAMLGEARGEHLLAADTLRLSALHDAEDDIRRAAYAVLERHARRPAEDVAN